ncbi:MAG TPA: hypothetical protein PK345_01860 [Bacteroidales bacterium]|jgi:hypothetical protein|nr:hypothetical protein [Bacteroidales bacterium]MBP7873452.1 hypothetical protein [Bacteroidales bacterium]MCZ2281593.1 hypothetical protein [Bacteroidales bacterium]HPX33800.1 hypothetical protein [Bacteroidales bacterium]
MAKKKIVHVGGNNSSNIGTTETFKPTAESKSKATRLRVISAILWLLAIGAQVVAISLLFRQPINMMWIIILIVIDLALAITGSILWKKSNRLDPASEKNKFLFFMQSQLGLVVAIIAFLPLVIFILTNKNLDAKQKGILGGIAGLALIIAGVTGIDFNPPSVEQYTEQTQRVEELTGKNEVYWTKSGTKYHIYEDCHAINKDVTTEIFQGTVAQARELKNITELCKFCENRAAKEVESDIKQEKLLEIEKEE